MQDFDAIEYIEDALTATGRGLGPFIAARFAEIVPELTNWPDILAQKDRQAGRNTDRYNPRDLSLMLRVLTEQLGTLGYPFSDLLTRQARNCASELRTVRNKWAHNEDFSTAETFRALDSAEVLLREVHATAEADLVAARKSDIVTVMAGATTVDSAREAAIPANDDASPEALPSAPTVTPAELSGSSTRLEISMAPVLSFAHAHNAVPVGPRIEVVHEGDELRGASVEVELLSPLGALGDPRIVLVDVGAGTRTILTNADLILDPARMLTVDTPVQASVVVTLRNALDEIVSRAQTEVKVLAANQWQLAPLELGIELLATYIQPQASAIAPLLVEASEILGERTPSSALDGYQQESAERVDAAVEAIYDAMRARDIRYAEPSSSWGLAGQKIRTPAEVLEGRLGTCLDTTVTFAAALEEAGINSTLWLLDGHIFLGYWRVEASLDAPAHLDASEVVNYVGLNQLKVVETTALTGGAASKTFAEATRLPHQAGHVSHPDAVLGVLDVRQARSAGVLPLPSRSVSADGEVTVREYQVGAGPAALDYSPSAEELAGTPGRILPGRVETWKNALLDLSLRNRLINYTASAGFSLAVPQPSIAQFEDMISEGTAITLTPSDRVSGIATSRGRVHGRDLPENARAQMLAAKRSIYIDIPEETYPSRLRNLAYKARTISEETGSNNLYVAFGMLRWTFNDRELRSPLILVPVTIDPSARGSLYRLRADTAGESTPNYCLLEKLRVSLGIEIPGLANPAKDDAGVNLPAVLAATRKALAESQLPFTVEDAVELSILQFGKYRLWKDLDEHWETFATNPLVNHLIKTPTQAFEDPSPVAQNVDLDALGNTVPVPADSSQLEAISEAVAERTFVLEGPPGTGKSQTITNLLAHALVSGKKVLFVAEKRAALDVVKDRLDAVGLGTFSLDLHDKGARPKQVRAQIQAALDATSRPDEAALKAHGESVASSRGSLRRYAERLHQENGAGMSLYSARERLLAFEGDLPSLDVPASVVTSLAEEQIASIRTALRELPETADLAHPSALNAWGFVTIADEHPVELAPLHQAAREFDTALAHVVQIGADSSTLAFARSAEFIERWSYLANAPRYSLETLDLFRARDLSGEVALLQQRITSMTTTSPAWTTTVALDALESDVAAVHGAAQVADASGFFGRRKRQRAALSLYGSALKVTPKKVPAKSVSTLTAQVVSTAESVGALRGALSSLPVVHVPPTWNPYLRDDAQVLTGTIEWTRWLSGALAPRDGADEATNILRAYYGNSAAETRLASALGTLAKAWRSLETLAAGRGDTPVLSPWAGNQSVTDAWSATRGSRALDTEQPTSLGRWVDFVRTLAPLRAHGLTDARDALISGRVSADLAVMAFDKGAAESSLKERAGSQALEGFDAAAHTRTIMRFATATSDIRSELPRAIPAQILAGRRIAAGYSGGQLGELKRQLGRQRGGMSVRELFSNYGELITQIAPCALMSPESVSRFFPAVEGMFDIVVFDEASQIRVADAVGAMGRARSVVVVGDSKQMPPSSFAEVASGTDSDTGPVMNAESIQDEESILTECVQAQVPRKWLSWHYRSQDEALISFSNHTYYESRLASFPAPWPTTRATADSGHGVSLVRVDGTFNRSGRGRDLRTNAVEAQAIVDEVIRRFAVEDAEAPSIGIVTFNAPQRSLIEAMLREAPDERIAAALDERDGLFVKNLENVQGDERDVILFSVAFSANERGVLPLNFGPLTRAGGERRLNVAITRARRQVILFVSFDPHELRAENTTSVGIKHLRSYLDLAAAGVDAVASTIPRERLVDRHRDEIANELRLRGFAVQTDIGLSDFRVDISIATAEKPDQPLVALLLDGTGWRARRTVADRDGLPVEVLSKLMRWPGVERVWLPEWLQNRGSALDRIEKAVVAAGAAFEAQQAALQELRERPAQDEAAPRPRDDVRDDEGWRDDSVAADDLVPVRNESMPIRGAASASEFPALLSHPHLRNYVEWNARTVGTLRTLDSLPAPHSVMRVQDLINEVVATEGPIHKLRLAKLVAGAFGLNKVHASRAEAILRCVPADLLRTEDPATLWVKGTSPLTWRDARQSEAGAGRNIDHVPVSEIANAMTVLAELAGGMSHEELKRETLNLFGGKRLTAGIGERLEQGLRFAIATERITQGANGLYVAIPAG